MPVSGLLAQTEVKLPKNRYTPEQDVKIGREAAAEIRRQYPIIKDERITSYLTMLGDRLVAAAPAELKQPVYEYSFTPVNLKEINANPGNRTVYLNQEAAALTIAGADDDRDFAPIKAAFASLPAR